MYYVSYGSNMNIDHMAWRCPNTRKYGNGMLTGWKLVFNHHADIIETGDRDDHVPVVVWTLDDEDDLAALDMYEGYPSYYIRCNIDVMMDDTYEMLEAMVYVMADSRKGVYPPEEDYLNIIKDGYIENGIDLQTLTDAAEFSMKEENQK